MDGAIPRQQRADSLHNWSLSAEMARWNDFYRQGDANTASGTVDLDGRRQGWWHFSHGYEVHYVDDKICGPGGGAEPAVLCKNGRREWWTDGALHGPGGGRGPAVVDPQRRLEPASLRHEYFEHGRKVRHVEYAAGQPGVVVAEEYKYDADGKLHVITEEGW